MMKEEGLNDHEKLLLFNLAVDEDEFAETNRVVRRKGGGGDVEPPDAECRVKIPFRLRGGNKHRNQRDQRKEE